MCGMCGVEFRRANCKMLNRLRQICIDFLYIILCDSTTTTTKPEQVNIIRLRTLYTCTHGFPSRSHRKYYHPMLLSVPVTCQHHLQYLRSLGAECL